MAGLLIRGVEHARDPVSLELKGGPAPTLGTRRPHQLAPRFRILRLFFRDLGGAIEADPVAESPAKQIAGRRVEDPARQIPQSDLYAARSRNGSAANGARSGALHQHLGVELIDVQRVLA